MCYETIQSGQVTLRRRCINAGALCLDLAAIINLGYMALAIALFPTTQKLDHLISGYFYLDIT